MSDSITRLNTALSGRYHIESELGEGGMATVYLADDIKHERKVALKLLKPELAALVGAERFLAEIKTTANLQVPAPDLRSPARGSCRTECRARVLSRSTCPRPPRSQPARSRSRRRRDGPG